MCATVNENKNMKSYITRSFTAIFFTLAILPLYSQPNLRFYNFPYTNIITVGQGGDFMSSGCFIYNRGNTTSSECSVGYYLSKDIFLSNDDILLAENKFTSLVSTNNYAASAYNYPQVLKIPLNLAVGEYTLIHKIDNKNQVTETQENDNEESEKIIVQAPFFDLSTSNFLLDTDMPIGDKSRIRLNFVNNGNTHVSGINVEVYLSSDSVFQLSDLSIGNFVIEYLKIKESYSKVHFFTAPDSLSERNYYVFCKVDKDDKIQETDEANNTKKAKTNFKKPYSDLKSVISTFSNTISSGVYLKFYNQFVSLNNNGNYGLKNIKYRFIFSDDTINKPRQYLQEIKQLDSLSRFSNLDYRYYLESKDSIFVPNELLSGKNYLGIWIDPSNEIKETNETNNITWFSINIKDSVYFPGTELEKGGNCTFNPTSIKSCNKVIKLNSLGQGTCFYGGNICKIKSEKLGETLNLNFNQFSVGKDSIAIYDNEVFVGKYGGSQNPGLVTSKTGYIRLARFASGFDMPGNETFLATISCGSIITNFNETNDNTLQNEIEVFPNPTSSTVEISSLNKNEGKLEIINIHGQLIDSFLYTPEQIDFSSYAKGMYLLKWNSGKKIVTKTVLVK